MSQRHISSITLGTAQLGLPYGVANRKGQPSFPEASAILDAAVAGGVTVLDTAQAYGQSEAWIGRWLSGMNSPPVIVTKIPHIDASGAAAGKAVSAAIDRSTRALGQQSLDLLLTHSETDLLRKDIASAFETAARDGRIAGYGASVYSPDVALLLLDQVPISALQVPSSVVDQRFLKAGVFEKATQKGVRIFIRSAFLQGALLMSPAELPGHLSPMAAMIEKLREFSHDIDRPLHEILLVAMRDIAGVASVVIGVESTEQLPPHLKAIRAAPLGANSTQTLFSIADGLPDTIINPARWPK